MWLYSTYTNRLSIKVYCVYRGGTKGKGKGLLFRGRVPVSNLDIEDIEDGTCESLHINSLCAFVYVYKGVS